MSTLVTDKTKAHLVPSVSLSKLVFSSGDEVALKPTDKIMLVGANNSGKSRTIREIARKISEGEPYADLVVLKSIEIKKVGGFEDLKAWVDRSGKLIGTDYIVGDWSISQHALQYWNNPFLMGGLAAGFIKNLDAATRLAICELQVNVSPGEAASKPQHLLYRNDALMQKVSDQFKRAFGSELMIDFLGGARIPIYIGTKPSGAGFEDRASTRYSEAVSSQPALHEQGDGMKSYAGILFEAMASGRNILCIDEPEAFLHPPQARRLGEALSAHVPGQLIVATHSSDILRGFLEGNKGKVRILRIVRDGVVNRIYEAGTESIEALWKTPILRFSNALDAIFHDQVILCEDDSDCRLISAVADHIQVIRKEAWPDTAYVPLGGKAGIPSAAKVLRSIGVPVKAIVDFDLLSDSAALRAMVEAFGGDWGSAEILWRRVSTAVSDRKAATAQQVLADIRDTLERTELGKFPSKKDIDEAFKRRSPWKNVKEFGLDGIPPGNPREACELLLGILESVGIFLVPGGEMESFCRSVGGHGPRFVTNVLTTVALDDLRLEALRNFTEKAHLGAAAPTRSVGGGAQDVHP